MTLSAMIFYAAEIWSRADLIALWSVIIGAIAIFIAILTLHRGNLNSSVASMVPLHAEIREMYQQYIQSFAKADFNTPGELEALELKIATSLERLMNILEIASAIEIEGTLSGVSRLLMRDYIRRTLDVLIADDYTNSRISELLQDEDTYIFIRRILRYWDRGIAVLPPKWYLYPNVSLFHEQKASSATDLPLLN